MAAVASSLLPMSFLFFFSILFFFSAPAAAAPLPPQTFRSLSGLSPKTTPHLVDEHGNKHFKHDYEHYHPQAGKTKLQYTAIVPPHVSFVDELPGLVDVSCTEETLTLHFSPDAVVPSFNLHDILIASSSFGCHQTEPSGRDHVRHLSDGGSGGGHGIIRRVHGSRPPTSSNDLTLMTSAASQHECFLDTDMAFTYTPPFHDKHPIEAARSRRELYDDAQLPEDERRLINLDELLTACMHNSTMNWVGDAEIDCNLDVLKFFDFYADMFSVNYDPIAQGSDKPVIYAMEDTVRFDDSYAMMNLEINSHLKVSKYSLEEFRVTVDGHAHAQSIVTITDPVKLAEAFLNQVLEELDVGGCMQTIEFWISYVPVRIKPCWDLAVEFHSSADIADMSVRTGFYFDATLSLGIESNQVTEGWDGIKEWTWDLTYYRPLWHVPQLTEDSWMRFYVVPQITFVLYDIIPLLIYPKPFIGVNFKHMEAVSPERTAQEGMGVWKVYIGEAQDLSNGSIISPSSYIKVQVMGCLGTTTRSNEFGPLGEEGRSATHHYGAIEDATAALVYKKHKSELRYDGEQHGSRLLANSANRTNTTTPYVVNPGCMLATDTKILTSSPDFNEWLIFEHAPMFQFEAARDQRLLIQVWEDTGPDWFTESEDRLLGEVVFDAAGAAALFSRDRKVFDTSVDVAGGKVPIQVKWELLSTEELATYLTRGSFAPEVRDGCWRPDGSNSCDEWEAHREDLYAGIRPGGRRYDRRLATCQAEAQEGEGMQQYATTCECEGLNAYLNFGLDLAIGIGEIDLDFSFSYEKSSYSTKRYFSGLMIQFNVWPQTQLVCLDCEGCTAVLNEQTKSDGWMYSKTIDEETGNEVGWVKKSDDSALSVGAKVGIGVGVAVFVLAVAVAAAMFVRRARGGAEGGVENDFLRLGFRSQTGGAGKKMASGKDVSAGAGVAMQQTGPTVKVHGKAPALNPPQRTGGVNYV